MSDYRDKYGSADAYRTQDGIKPSAFPSASLYGKILCGPFLHLYSRTKNDHYSDVDWANSSAWCADILESIGGKLFVDGLSNIDSGPYVFIANHMSTLETFLLPGMIRPRMPLTFVVKESLVKIPLFGAIMRSRNPVLVGRRNPREDLHAVLEQGAEKLRNGISIVVFPQSTRSLTFSRELFNTIGVKLARKAGVQAIPIALKTDLWGQGRLVKDFGRIRPELPVRIRFGKPISIEGNGKNEHGRIVDFIEKNVTAWQAEDGI